MNIFLDDTRNPYDVFLQTINPLYEHNHTWEIIRDYDQFISFIINNGVPELISFDHDLDQSHYLPINQTNIDYNNMEIKCGYHCLEWLINYCEDKKINLPEILIHSQNMEGKRNMERLINSFK